MRPGWEKQRIHFTLTQTLTFKRLKCLDYLHDELQHIADMDGEALQRDARITLLAGELRSLCNSVAVDIADKIPQPKAHDPSVCES